MRLNMANSAMMYTASADLLFFPTGVAKFLYIFRSCAVGSLADQFDIFHQSEFAAVRPAFSRSPSIKAATASSLAPCIFRKKAWLSRQYGQEFRYDA